MRIRHWHVALYALISVLALAAIPLSAAGSNAAFLWLLGRRAKGP